MIPMMMFIIIEKEADSGIRMPVMSCQTYNEAEKQLQNMRVENPGNAYYLYQVPHRG